MKQGLQLRFSQNLSLTPQLQQAIRLLQMSTVELNQEIDALMQTNPLLERGEAGEDEYGNAVDDVPETGAAAAENFSAEADAASALENGLDADFSGSDFQQASLDIPIPDTRATEIPAGSDNADSDVIGSTGEFQTEFTDEFEEYSSNNRWDESNAAVDDENDFSPQETLQKSLRDHLLDQIKLMPFSERDQTLVLLLIDSINDDGYLEEPLEDIAAQLPEDFEVDILELQTALRHIQHLDPLGVGARNLGECLLLQLAMLDKNTPHIDIAKKIAKQHLPALGARDFNKLRKELNCDEATLKAAQQLITHLNPRPGSQFSVIGSEHYIQHEIIVKKNKGIWIASLNDSVIPKLKINQMYAGILKRNRDSSSQYLQSQMQEAKWMIKNIQQRFSTILRVSQAIVDRQRNFLEYGEVAMRPLVLREIADELGLHESTISRVTTNKFMLTPRGIFELKYFFGSSVSTEAGGTCSATAIRALIKKMVDEEDPKKPYSDNQITDLLQKQGIVVARRTIAKYRESLNIAPANLRKTL
jgi:RNA polymerase sigma-54 factor